MRIQRVGLEHHRQPALGRRIAVASAPSISIAVPGDILQPGDQAQQRRLAATRRPDEDDELAILDLQIQRRDDLDVAEALRNLFRA